MGKEDMSDVRSEVGRKDEIKTRNCQVGREGGE